MASGALPNSSDGGMKNWHASKGHLLCRNDLGSCMHGASMPGEEEEANKLQAVEALAQNMVDGATWL